MKNSAKIGLIIALFSILGAGTFIKAVHATQTQPLVESVKSASVTAIALSTTKAIAFLKFNQQDDSDRTN